MKTLQLFGPYVLLFIAVVTTIRVIRKARENDMLAKMSDEMLEIESYWLAQAGPNFFGIYPRNKYHDEILRRREAALKTSTTNTA